MPLLFFVSAEESVAWFKQQLQLLAWEMKNEDPSHSSPKNDNDNNSKAIKAEESVTWFKEQLKRHGWEMKNNEEEDSDTIAPTWCHPYFRKDQKDLLDKIKKIDPDTSVPSGNELKTQSGENVQKQILTDKNKNNNPTDQPPDSNNEHETQSGAEDVSKQTQSDKNKNNTPTNEPPTASNNEQEKQSGAEDVSKQAQSDKNEDKTPTNEPTTASNNEQETNGAEGAQKQTQSDKNEDNNPTDKPTTASKAPLQELTTMPSSGGPNNSSITPRKSNHTRPPAQNYPTTKSNKIALPFTLKKVMIRAYETLRQKQMISVLPAATSVREVLDMYVELKEKKARSKSKHGNNFLDFGMSTSSDAEDGSMTDNDSKNNDEDKAGHPISIMGNIQNSKSNKKRKIMGGWNDMADGIAMFFDKALESHLLYKQEIPQFQSFHFASSSGDDDMDVDMESSRSGEPQQSPTKKQQSPTKKQQQRPCDIYGCEHLLRLLIRLPEILSESMTNYQQKQCILYEMVEFVAFLHQQEDRLFHNQNPHTSFRKLTRDELAEIKLN